MLTFKTPITDLTRVGKAIACQMGKLEIKTAGNLLTHYPFRYDDYSKILTIKDLKTKKTGTVKVKINLIANHRSPRKKMIITEAIVSDQTDSLKVIWFNQGFLTRTLKSGQQVYLAGKIDDDNYYGLQLTNPSYELCKDKNPIHTGRLVPIYPSTTKLSQKQIRFLTRQILPLIQEIPDWLPREIKIKYNLISLSVALEQIHFPQNKLWLEKAIHRLKFDELFLIQSQNQLIRQRIKNREAFPVKFKLKETKKFVQNLDFKLTEAQRKTSWEIINDIEKNFPMNRLLEGDVGSGKTIVAVIAILNALLNKYQAAYMAPTEILAEQHFKNIIELFTPPRDKSLTGFKNFKIALLTRNNAKINSGRKIKKTELLKQLALGKIDLIIGTHSLIQEKIKLKRLSLAIIDEQHRFGVTQRAKLINQSGKEKTKSPHFLSMTATPIPRSMALTLYGDLDLSIIDQIPPGRKKIITKVIKLDEIKQTYQFIKKEISKGHQAFVVCPLIDPSDKLGVKSVKEEYEKLSKHIFPNLKIALLHGKLKSEQKEKIMKDFNKNKINILVSTTVIEVGIDIPNASIIVIKGAERFGLAQLYQLRGRIGRSQNQSYCFLFVENEGEKVQKRLQTLLQAKNGFELAERDLELRGPGEIFSTEQSGFSTNLKIARLSDFKIIKETRETANLIFKQDFKLKKYPLLEKKINESIKITHLE